MNDTPLFPAGLSWVRTEVPLIGLLRDVTYAVLWLFPTGNFQYISCWPGYSFFQASGAWSYKNGLIHCEGKSRSFTDGLMDNHTNRPYAIAFTTCADAQALKSVGADPQHHTRLDPQRLWRHFPLDEWTVPTRWQEFQWLMDEIEKAMGMEHRKPATFLSHAERRPFPS